MSGRPAACRRCMSRACGSGMSAVPRNAPTRAKLDASTCVNSAAVATTLAALSSEMSGPSQIVWVGIARFASSSSGKPWMMLGSLRRSLDSTRCRMRRLCSACRGSTPPSFFTTVTARRAISRALSTSCGRPTSRSAAAGSTFRSRSSPRRSFASRIRSTETSMREAASWPSRTARTIARMATSACGGSRIMSAPACTARIAASPVHAAFTPAISIASVTMSPSKWSCWRSRSVAIGAERVAGAPLGSTAGTAMWPCITASTPASTARRNGRSSTDSSRARSAPTVASCRWLSTAVSPCPGKCLAVVSSPPSRAPRTNAASSCATSSGSSP